jgi:hypothetical protein
MPGNVDIPNLPMILLKKRLLSLSILAKHQLKNYLSTCYGKSMVVQGLLSACLDSAQQIQNIPEISNLKKQGLQENLIIQLRMSLEQIQNLGEFLGMIMDIE